MQYRRLLGSLMIFTLVLCLSISVFAAEVPIPSVEGPIPASSDSYPFDSVVYPTASASFVSAGYVEEEYFYSGTANVYNWNTAGAATLTGYKGPYKNRMLIRRPASPACFSGKVIVELINSTAGSDNTPIWSFLSSDILRNGDIYVGITTKPVSIAALKTFNDTRYNTLSWANPAPPDTTNLGWGYPIGVSYQSNVETQDGLVWDVTSQAGALLKSTSMTNPLRSYHVRYVYLSGHSQSASLTTTYVNAIQPIATLENGYPVFDGYLICGGATPYQINQNAASPNAPDDPREFVNGHGIPVIRVMSEGDFKDFTPFTTLYARQDDSDAFNDKFRGYEVTGSDHGGSNGAGLAVFIRGAYNNLHLWASHNVPPPRAKKIELTNTPDPVFVITPAVAVDQYGNTKGGLRSPWLDVPIAKYTPHLPGISTSMPFSTFIIYWAVGTCTPFSDAQLRAMYRVNDVYVSLFTIKTDELLAQRFITATDAAQMKTDVLTAPILLGTTRAK